MNKITKPITLIRYLRQCRGESLRTVADACGMTAGQLSQFERGHRGIAVGKALCLAAYFGVNIDVLAYDRFEEMLSAPDGQGNAVGSDSGKAEETANIITGVEYFRRKAKLSINALVHRTGFTERVIREMCLGKNAMKRSLLYYIGVAEIFGATAEQLLQFYDEASLDEGDHTVYPSRTECLANCVAVYRRQKGLTFAQLGERLGRRTKECARQACAVVHPLQNHVETLAHYEGISPDEFCWMYASWRFNQGDAT